MPGVSCASQCTSNVNSFVTVPSFRLQCNAWFTSQFEKFIDIKDTKQAIELQKQVIELQKMVVHLEHSADLRLEAAEKRSTDLQMQVNRFDKEYELMEQQLIHYQQRSIDMQKSCQEQRTSLLVAFKRIGELEKERDKLKSAVKELHDGRQERLLELQEIIRSHEERNNLKEDRIASLVKSRATMHEEHAQQLENVRETYIHSIEEQNKSLKATFFINEKLKQEIHRLQEECAALEEKCAARDATIDDQCSQIEEYAKCIAAHNLRVMPFVSVPGMQMPIVAVPAEDGSSQDDYVEAVPVEEYDSPVFNGTCKCTPIATCYDCDQD